MAGMEAKEEDEEEEEKKEKKEKEKERRTTKLELRKKVSTIAMPGAGLLLLFWGLQRGYPLWTCFLAFFNKGFIRKSKLLLIKSEGCFEKDLLYLTLLAILKVNGANWLLVLEKKLELGKKFPLLPCWAHYWPCPLDKVWTWLLWQY